MTFTEKKVKGYSTNTKHLLMINGEPVLFADSSKRIALFIQYIEGYVGENEINDKKILKVLDGYRKLYGDSKRKVA